MRNPKKQDTVFRVDQATDLMSFMLSKMGGMTRTSIKTLLSHRQVLVNRVVQTRHDTALNEGDTIVIQAARGNTELTHPKLRIVYEDEHLIVANKKEGLLTVSTHQGSAETTVFSILKDYVRKQNRRAGVYVVNRLDRETSGLLIFAKSQEMQHYLRDYWQELAKDRCYVALAEGTFDKKENTIITWFTEDRETGAIYSSPVDDGGKKSITHYKVLREINLEGQALSLVELHLETGRTNQIRIHLAGIGHPVLGDRKYGNGNTTSPFDRLCLHARSLSLIHPATEKVVKFEAPLPKCFQVR